MDARLLGWGLRVWALLQVYAAGLWIIGPFGAGDGGLSRTLLPEWLSQPLSYGLQGLTVGPITGVVLTAPNANPQVADLGLHLSGNQGAETLSSTFGDINLNATAQFSVLSGGQGWAWVALHAVPLLLMAALWWLLAKAAIQSGSATVFTTPNARLLSIAGIVLSLGSIALSALTRWFYTWIASTSQIMDKVRIPDYSWHTVPWAAVVAGAALLVLGDVWRRGIAIEAELGGLV